MDLLWMKIHLSCVMFLLSNKPTFLCNTTHASSHNPNSIGRVSLEMLSCKHFDRERRTWLCDWAAYPCLLLLPWQICTWSIFPSLLSSSTLDPLSCRERQALHSVIILKINVLGSFDYWFAILSLHCALMVLTGFFSYSKGWRSKGCLFGFSHPITIQNVILD